MKQLKKWLSLGLLIILLTACSGTEETAVSPTSPAATSPAPISPTTNLRQGCLDNYQADVDYFPEKATITQAAGFTIEYFDHYKLITVNEPWQGAEAGEQYLLVQCGAPTPDGYEDAHLVQVPVTRFVAMSTTYLPYLVELDLLDQLVGLDSFLYLTTPEVRELIDNGALAEVGFGAGVNIEQALALEPDLVMVYASGSPDFDAHPKLREANIPVALNAELLETTPLGQTEWMKFVAAIFNAEAAAETAYNEVVTAYTELVSLAAAITERPTVFVNTPFGDTWYMPGGQSYVAHLLADAGAQYLWADDDSTGSLFLAPESVFDQAADADFWLNQGYFGSLADLQATDDRFTAFAAYANGRVYNNDLTQNENGGNDYYEGGIAHPDWILADLIAIFHPELLPDHQFIYYRELE